MVDVELLRKFSLFKELDEPQLQRFANNMQGRIYPPGSTVCSRGEQGDEMFFVNQGKVSVMLPLHRHDSRYESVAEIGEGNFLGELSFFDGQERSADVQAKGKVEILVFSRQDYDKIVKDNLKEGCQIQGKIISGLVGIIRDMNETYSSGKFLV